MVAIVFTKSLNSYFTYYVPYSIPLKHFLNFTLYMGIQSSTNVAVIPATGKSEVKMESTLHKHINIIRKCLAKQMHPLSNTHFMSYV